MIIGKKQLSISMWIDIIWDTVSIDSPLPSFVHWKCWKTGCHKKVPQVTLQASAGTNCRNQGAPNFRTVILLQLKFLYQLINPKQYLNTCPKQDGTLTENWKTETLNWWMKVKGKLKLMNFDKAFEGFRESIPTVTTIG